MRRIVKASRSPSADLGLGCTQWLVASALSLALGTWAHAGDASPGHPADPIRARDAATAYAELSPQEEMRAGDPSYDYLLGLAALDSGHVTHAIFAFERVLATRPDNHPARAELARAYLAGGEIENARSELEQVRRTDMPQDAAAAIDRVLGMLDQVAPSGRPSFAGYAEIGGGWDSNVNSATNAGQFAIPAFGGLLFNVAPGSGRISDEFGSVAAGASVQVPLARGWSVFGGIDARSTLNATAHDINTSVAAGSVGVSHVAGRHAQTAALQTNAAWISSSRYRNADGASLQWQSQLDAASQASLFAQWSRLTYTGQTERDADRSVLGSGYARQFSSKKTLAYASLYVARERARDGDFPYHGHRAAGWRLGGEHKVGTATVLFAEWQYERRRYGGSEPLFDVRRNDHQADLLAGIRVALASQWQLVPRIRHTAASSNVVLFDYGRTVLEINLRREFK